MSGRWEWALLWFLAAAAGVMLIAYALGLYGAVVGEPWQGFLVGAILLGLGLYGLRSEYRRR